MTPKLVAAMLQLMAAELELEIVRSGKNDWSLLDVALQIKLRNLARDLEQKMAQAHKSLRRKNSG